MADNVAITAGAGTTIAADDVGSGVLHQRVKVTWGPDGTGNDADVASGKSLPVQIRSSTGLIPIGEPTDAKSTSTDTTSVSLISIAKQISASVQSLVTAIGSTAWDLGSGTIGSRTQRITHATDDPIIGIAHDGVDSGNGPKIMAKAKTSLSAITAVAANDRTDLYAGSDGILITRSQAPLGDIVSGVASNTDGTSTQVIAAAGAGIKQYLKSVSLVNMHATSTIYVELKSGTTVKWRLPCPPGGCVQTFDVPLPPNAANEAWNFQASAATTTIYCSMIGFTSVV